MERISSTPSHIIACIIALMLLVSITYSSTYEDINLILSPFSYFLLIFGHILVLVHSARNNNLNSISINPTVLILYTFLFFLILISSVRAGPIFARLALPVVAWHLLLLSILIVFAAWYSKNSSEVLRLMATVLIGFALASFLGAVVYEYLFMEFTLETVLTNRLSGWYGNPNRLGSVLAVGATCTFAHYIHTRSRYHLISLFFLSLGMIWSGSRGAIIAFICAIAVILLVNGHIGSNSQNVANRDFTRVALSVIILSSPIIFVLAERRRTGDSVGSRMEIFQEGYNIILSSSTFDMLLGHGHPYFYRFVGRSSHLLYLKIMVDFGFIFSIAFFILIIIVIKRVFWSYSEDNLYLITQTGLIVFVLSRSLTTPAIFNVRFTSLIFVLVIALAMIETGQEE